MECTKENCPMNAKTLNHCDLKGCPYRTEAIINKNLVKEQIKMLMEQEEFAFIKDIPTEQLWKLIFAIKFIDESAEEYTKTTD